MTADLRDKVLVEVAVVDIADTARRIYPDPEALLGRPAPEHDYRLIVKTPTGGEIAFHSGATAEDVVAYWQREGWL